jgi:glycosidase
VRTIKPDVFTVGEVTYPIDTVLTYYPDQLTSYFAFEVADGIISAVRRGDSKGMLAPVLRLQGSVPQGRWSPFVRNHDQVRTRTELGGDIAKAKIAATILLTMPGMPFVYYGEEIGMIGAKPDERLRTPMQWSAERGEGFTTGTPWEQLQSDSLTTTVAAEERDAGSMLALHRRLIHLRDRCAALNGERIVPLTTSSDAVVAYLRESGDSVVLIFANLSEAALTGVAMDVSQIPLTARISLSPPSKGDAKGLPVRWKANDLVGHESAASIVFTDENSLKNYIPLATIPPKSAHVFALSSGSHPSCQ